MNDQDVLNEILAHHFGPHLPPELEVIRDEILADGVVTETERLRMIDAVAVYLMQQSRRPYPPLQSP